ncbi:MAG TPA: hypothetical protein VHY36_10175 [Steroidobacteraceae bacterium]|jgi:hypothetical protein|nr:hypothetical protein [Steroidobacteraceae bacterium]
MRRGVRSSRLAVVGAILFALGACVTRQIAPPAPAQAPAARPLPSPPVGSPFDVIPAESRLVVRVYRAGALAALGHNHIVACRCLTGTIYLPRDPARTSFDLRLAVTQLTVDDPVLRAAEHSADFPPDVAPSARQATRHNMLSSVLLNAASYPDIALRSAGLRPSPDGRRDDIVVQVLVQLGGEWHSVAVPMRREIQGDEITVSGEFPLRQTELGLTPFTALGGGLRVKDGMKVWLRLVARRRSGR